MAYWGCYGGRWRIGAVVVEGGVLVLFWWKVVYRGCCGGRWRIGTVVVAGGVFWRL